MHSIGCRHEEKSLYTDFPHQQMFMRYLEIRNRETRSTRSSQKSRISLMCVSHAPSHPSLRENNQGEIEKGLVGNPDYIIQSFFKLPKLFLSNKRGFEYQECPMSMIWPDSNKKKTLRLYALDFGISL